MWPFGKRETVTVIERRTTVPLVKRSYDGATNGPLYRDFTSSLLSADAELNVALSKLRARARNLERNNGHARRYIQLMQDNVVGHQGFNLMVQARNVTNGKLDSSGNSQIKDAWRKYCEKVTADGMMSMVETTRMAVRTWARDGEVFIQEVVGGRRRDSIEWHFVEADMVDETLSETYRPTGNRIKMGVEIDGFGRPVAYHVLTTHPGDYTWTHRAGAKKYVRVSADKMIHVFVKRRPGQTRGEPPLAPVMNDIKMLGGYREAEITHRRVAASKMGFFEREQKAGPVSAIADAVDDEELIIEASPGKMKALPEGYSFKAFDANSTHTDYAAFEKQIIRSIATGLGPSYFDMAMDLEDVSYSSIRQGALSDRDFYRGMQVFFINAMQLPMYRRWLELNFGGMNDMISLPLSKFDKFYNASRFVPRGWEWVDPQKEVKASIEAEKAGYTTKSAIIAEKGGDIVDVIAVKEAEQTMLENSSVDFNKDAE